MTRQYRLILDFVQPHFGGGTSQVAGTLPPELRGLFEQSANRMINTQNNLPYDQFINEQAFRRVLGQDPMEEYAYGQLPNLITPSQFAMQGLADANNLPALFAANNTTMGGLAQPGSNYEFMREWMQPGAGLYNFSNLFGLGGEQDPQNPQGPPPPGEGEQERAPVTPVQRPPRQPREVAPRGSGTQTVAPRGGGDEPIVSQEFQASGTPSEAPGWENDPRFLPFSFRNAFEGDPSGAASFLEASGINRGFAEMQAKRRASQAERGLTDNPITQLSNRIYEQGPTVDPSGRIQTDQGSHNWSGPRLLESIAQFADNPAMRESARRGRTDLSALGAPTEINAQGQRVLAPTRAQAAANAAQAGFTPEARAAMIAENDRKAREAQEAGLALGAGTNQWTQGG